jgi:hypothetical protein
MRSDRDLLAKPPLLFGKRVLLRKMILLVMTTLRRRAGGRLPATAAAATAARRNRKAARTMRTSLPAPRLWWPSCVSVKVRLGCRPLRVNCAHQDISLRFAGMFVSVNVEDYVRPFGIARVKDAKDSAVVWVQWYAPKESADPIAATWSATPDQQPVARAAIRMTFELPRGGRLPPAVQDDLRSIDAPAAAMDGAAGDDASAGTGSGSGAGAGSGSGSSSGSAVASRRTTRSAARSRKS